MASPDKASLFFLELAGDLALEEERPRLGIVGGGTGRGDKEFTWCGAGILD